MFGQPQHPYTRTLLASVPQLHRKWERNRQPRPRAGRGGRVTKRATIADIAQRAGLSKGAVSYALNGLPGVSE